MQKGKDLHRGGGGLRSAVGPLLLVSIVWAAAAADPAASECCARLLAGCLRGVASGDLFFGAGARAGNRAGVHATVSNPYMIDGLAGSDLLSGIEGRSISAWIDWRHLGHELYHEDRVVAAMGFPGPLIGSLRLYVVPAIERRAVRGFEAEGSPSLTLGCSYDLHEAASFGFSRCAFEGGDPGPPNARVFLCVRFRFLLLAVDGALSGTRGRDAQCAFEARLAETFALTSRYRWRTGEMSSGLAVVVSRMCFDFSWSWNPALGGTAAVGAGRSWEW